MNNGKSNKKNLNTLILSKESDVKFTENPVRYICDKAFYAVRPESFPKEFDPVLAASYGLEAGQVVANYCKEVVYPNVVKPISKTLDVDFSLKNAAYTGILLVSGVLAKRLLNPKKTIDYIIQHPVMSAGALAVMSGATKVAFKTIKNERQKEFLRQQYGINI